MNSSSNSKRFSNNIAGRLHCQVLIFRSDMGFLPGTVPIRRYAFQGRRRSIAAGRW